MESNCRSIVWFRRDLRIEDNPALAAAARDGSVLPVFIWCPEEEGPYILGRVSRWWLKQSLIQLEQSLKSLGAELVLIRADSTLSALLDCIRAVGATKVVYNHLYDPVSLVRDHDITQKLGETGVNVRSYNGELLHEPWEVYDDNGNAFTVFDAYCDKCLKVQKEPVVHLPPCCLVQATGKVEKCLIDELGLEDESEKSSNALLGRGWSPGWANANKVFIEFIENHLLNYSKDRLRVHGNCTSLLSPYLHFGELSVRKIFLGVLTRQTVWKNEQNLVGENSANLFLKSMRLREYSRYICFHFPFTHERPLLSNLKFFPWSADQAHFKAWRQGRTGYPLVDAGMRELWATGWIHNRIRVIVSSFFVKFLILPWQWGMRYFWDALLDADLENDILGWQYISGSLPDGHALERMDIPQVQGFKYDPDGDYIRQWLPELAQIPCEWIHHPYDAPEYVLKSAGVDLGSNYPKPIIDIDLARVRLSEVISIMRGKELSARADGTYEEVFDNYDTHINLAIPNAVVKGKILFPDASSHYRRVNSVQNSEDVIYNRKMLKCSGAEKFLEDMLRGCSSGGERSKMDDDLRSTAESCLGKRQETSSRNPFSIPQDCSPMSHHMENMPSKNGTKKSLNDLFVSQDSLLESLSRSYSKQYMH